MADACAASVKNSGQHLRDKPDGATVPAELAVGKIDPQNLVAVMPEKKFC
jgi:hypothetical protein